MKIKRIVSNVEASTLKKAPVQISFASEGGSGTPVPDLSIEVDDIEAALKRVKKAGISIVYGPQTDLGEFAGSTFGIHSES